MSGPASDWPGRYPVLIGSRAFPVDTSYEAFRRQSFHHDTIPSQRESIDLTNEPGEGTINTEGLWRRTGISWHHGAGQLYYDRKESDPFRFYASLGVDPWNQDQLTLLPAVTERLNDSSGSYGNTAKVVLVNGTVWVLETTIPAASGSNPYRLRYAPDWSTWTTPSDLPAYNINDICTDGANIYIAGYYGAGQGVWIIPYSAGSWGTPQQIITDGVERIWYAGGRLLVAVGAQIWDATSVPTTSGAGAPVALAAGWANNFFTHPNANWHWSDFDAGEAYLYGAGNVLIAAESLADNALGESAVYQFTTSSASGGIAPGVALLFGGLAWQPPFGEQVYTIVAYNNFIFLGTTQGVRCCRTVSLYDPSGNAGDLVSGPVIPNLTAPFNAPGYPFTGRGCYGIVGYNRFVYFLWPGYVYNGTTYWGLGRLDLGNFLADLQPAYTADLMIASSVNSTDLERGCVFWDPVANCPGFVIPGGSTNAGVYTADYNVSIPNEFNYVTTGYLRTGLITYGIQDNKTVAMANLKSGPENLYYPYDNPGGEITLDVAYDRGGFESLAPLAPNQAQNPPTLVTPLVQAEEIEVEALLAANLLSAVILESDPSGYWPLNEQTGTTAYDDSGGGHNGTAHGGVTVGQAGPPGTPYTAYQFNGSSGYVATTLAPASGAWTIAAVAYVPETSIGQQYPRIISSESDSLDKGAALGIGYTGASGGTPSFAFVSAGTGSARVSFMSASLSAGWHLFVGSWDGSSTLSLYVDGVLEGTTPLATYSPGSQDWWIGVDTSGDYWPGEIAQAAVYPSALSPATIQAQDTSAFTGQRPFLNRWTIKSWPNVVSGRYIYVALQLYVRNDMQGTTDFSDPYGDYEYLETLRLNQTIITYKEAPGLAGATAEEATVVVDELYWMPEKRRDDADAGYQGVLVVTLKSIVG